TAMPTSLVLQDNPALISIAALQKVTGIGRLVLQNDAKLDNIALPKLTRIPGDLIITDATALQDLSGLGAVQTVGGTLTIENDPGLSPEEINAFKQQIGR